MSAMSRWAACSRPGRAGSARQAAIRAGLPTSVPRQTINKVCGSGLKAVITAAQGIALATPKSPSLAAWNR